MQGILFLISLSRMALSLFQSTKTITKMAYTTQIITKDKNKTAQCEYQSQSRYRNKPKPKLTRSALPGRWKEAEVWDASGGPLVAEGISWAHGTTVETWCWSLLMDIARREINERLFWGSNKKFQRYFRYDNKQKKSRLRFLKATFTKVLLNYSG